MIFKGLDKFLTDEEWQNINVFHPQYYFKNLIDILEIDRKNIKNLKENKENNLSKILSYSMLPYNFTYKWQDKLNLTEKDFSNYLDTKNIKDPDLLIRTSGELRLSNFLLWQIAYSELYFSDKLWPEFSANDLYIAIISYSFRKRRFGGR